MRLTWRMLWVVIVLLSPLFFTQAFIWLDERHPPPEQFAISVVDAVMGDELIPPSNAADWQTRTLPFSIRSVDRKNSLWYRLTVADLPPHSETLGNSLEPWTLSVGAPFGSVAVFRNGQLLTEKGRRDKPVSVYRWPVSVDISRASIEPDDILYVHFTRPNSTGWVYQNYLGPKSALKPYLDHQQFLRVTLPQWIQVIMCVVGVLMLALFWLRPGDQEYGWWGLMLFAWAMREATDLAVDPWVESAPLWVSIRAISLGAFALCGYVFIKRFLKIKRSPFDLAIWISGGVWFALLLSLGLSGVLTRELNNQFWTPWVIVVALLCCLQLARAAFAKPLLVGASSAGQLPDSKRDVWALLAVCWLISAVGFYDYKVPIDPHSIAGYVQYLQYSAGFALIVFTLILMKRFAVALGDVEQANSVLEERVEDQRQKLAKAFEKERKAEQQRLVLEERERIMQDMHDGIGGQLVQALSIVSQDPQLAPVEPALRQALDDLRLIIDSLSVPEGDLSMLLASFRHRLVRPIERAGLKFEWQLADLPVTAQLNQSELLHVLRILQESVTNILKHAEASVLRIATDVVNDEVRIKVIDNGRGFDADETRTVGRGLRNMRNRANKIGASLQVGGEYDGEGAQVELRLPLAGRASPSPDDV